MFGADILGLATIGGDVVELCVVHQSPVAGAHGTAGVFGFLALAGIPAADMGDEGAVGPVGLGISE